MCCCDKPNVNGTFGYKWQPNDPPSIRPVNPPELNESLGDRLLYDEPGRCGGMDCHSHHFRLVRDKHDIYCFLLVRHGGGDERIKLGNAVDCLLGHERRATIDHVALLDSNGRYWLLYTIYQAHKDAEETTRDTIGRKWSQAFIDKRIKKRKRHGHISVRIEPAIKPAL